MRLIDADALRENMYHEAFETDSEMQRWYSGCWIRYKMFENALNDAPTVDSVPVVRCKDCVFYDEPNDEWIWGCCKCTGAGMEPDGFCSDGERKNDG